MKKLDYIIVGLGIAGVSLCEHLLRSGKEFVIIDHPQQSATRTAGGIVNPVVLKRYSPVWKAKEFITYATPFYQMLGEHISSNFMNKTDILRLFSSFEDQNEWLVASDKRELSDFLSPNIFMDQKGSWLNTFGYGRVSGTFQIDTNQLLDDFVNYLDKQHHYRQEIFEYEKLEIQENEIQYKDLFAKKIIFSEGANVLKNPFFPKDVIQPKKGEYITIHAPNLDIKAVLKGPFFVIPLGKDHYKIGATFAHGDTTLGITEKGRNLLKAAIKKILPGSFEIVNQEVGLRPTVPDRKPILGNLYDHKNVFFLNGLGTRGLLMAPLLAKLLLEYSEDNNELPDEINLKRFLIQPSSDRI